MKRQKTLLIGFVSLIISIFLGTATPTPISAARTVPSAVTELQLLKSMPASTLHQTRGSRPDANGLVGLNQTGTFVANDQRGAMVLMEVGMVLGKNTDVADAWRAVEATYQRQTPAGDFGLGKDGNAAYAMNFWMAWSNHAILLLKHSKYEPAYASRIAALEPKIEKAMDFLMLQSSKDKLHRDDELSPNRTLINANAYGFGYLLLKGVTSQAKLDAYLAESQVWVENEFVNDKLYRTLDGVYTEKNGYDTSYQAVANWMFMQYLIHFPNPVPDAVSKAIRAGNWLEKRILSDGTVDCTYNTRSGPNNSSGDLKHTDKVTVMRSLLYWAAMFNKPEGNAAAARVGTSVNGLPPVIFSDLKATAALGQPFSYTIMATNAGLDSLSPSFSISAYGLPPGLKVTSQYGFYKSTGTLTIVGKPQVSGTFPVTIRARNSYGNGKTATLQLTVN